VAESHQHGEFDSVTDVVETIGGVLPQSLEAFIRQHQTVFRVYRKRLIEMASEGLLVGWPAYPPTKPISRGTRELVGGGWRTCRGWLERVDGLGARDR